MTTDNPAAEVAGPTGFRERAAAYAAPLLLVAIAVVQIARVHLYRQSTWAGVGFGMFATIDSHGTRFVRGYLSDGSTERYARVPAALAEEAMAVRVVPTEERAQRLADRWSALLPPEVASVRVEVWGVAFDDATHALSAHQLAASAPAAGSGRR